MKFRKPMHGLILGALLCGATPALAQAPNSQKMSPTAKPSVAATTASERAKRSVEEVIYLHLPRIVERRLSSKEKASISRLLNIFQKDPSWANMQPLLHLAESGDKKAMMAVLKSFEYKKSPSGRRQLYDAPLESWGAEPARFGIAGRWGAEYWIRYGKNRIAMKALSRCMPSVDTIIFDCGLGVVLNRKQQNRHWDYASGESRKAPKLEFNLTSPYLSEAELRKRFDTVGKTMGIGRDGRINIRPQHRLWLEKYVMIHPEAAPLLQEAKKTARKKEAKRVKIGREFVARRRDMHRDTFNALLAKDTLSAQEQRSLESAAAILGDDELSQYSSRYYLKQSSNIKRLCARNDRSCGVQANAENARQAAFDQELRQENRDAIARENALKVTGKSNLVTVRRYDNKGNYLGTTQMTKAQAEIAGAK